METNQKRKFGVGVGVMILRDGKVLLGKRHDDPKKASSALHGEGSWTMPGGKIDIGETLLQAALRETHEEIGATLTAPDLKLISMSDEIMEDAHFVTAGFLCTSFTGEISVMEPDEITTWQWFDINALPTPLFFPCRKIVDHYLKGVVYT